MPVRFRGQSFGVRIVNDRDDLPGWVEAEGFDKFKHKLYTHWHHRQYLTSFPPRCQ